MIALLIFTLPPADPWWFQLIPMFVLGVDYTLRCPVPRKDDLP